jgi:carboxyl-terminal processing protease
LAAAVKDQGGKNIVGTQTFGKGIVQATETLEAGDAIKLTIMQYFSPKGNAINEKGVKPDYVVKAGNGEEDKQLEKAISLL